MDITMGNACSIHFNAFYISEQNMISEIGIMSLANIRYE